MAIHCALQWSRGLLGGSGVTVASKLLCIGAEGFEIRIYAKPDGTEPYTAWEANLEDRMVRARIRARIARLRLGNLGDSKRVGEVLELRIHVGPGYRVHYEREGDDVVILLCGGKGSQARYIERAEAYWRDYRSRDHGKG